MVSNYRNYAKQYEAKYISIPCTFFSAVVARLIAKDLKNRRANLLFALLFQSAHLYDICFEISDTAIRSVYVGTDDRPQYSALQR